LGGRIGFVSFLCCCGVGILGGEEQYNIGTSFPEKKGGPAVDQGMQRGAGPSLAFITLAM